jgi:transposase InsO family protein
VPRLRAIAPNQLWSWDITYLPTTVRGIWLYLYLVIDVWSRKVVAWDVAEREDPAIAADLVSRACLRERISKRRRQPLILHADNGNAMRASTVKSRLEELGVLRSFSRPRVSNDNPHSESLFRTAKYRPDYTRRPFASKEEAEVDGFIGQFWPLTSLTPGGRNRVRFQCRPLGEFCLPESCVALHGSTSKGSGPG